MQSSIPIVLYNPAVYAAYVLSRRGLPGRGFFTAIVVIALVFNAGIIPGYLLVRARPSRPDG